MTTSAQSWVSRLTALQSRYTLVTCIPWNHGKTSPSVEVDHLGVLRSRGATHLRANFRKAIFQKASRDPFPPVDIDDVPPRPIMLESCRLNDAQRQKEDHWDDAASIVHDQHYTASASDANAQLKPSWEYVERLLSEALGL
jgi:hypothetical protein